MDIGEAMALTNSNNNWMNNPFMYLIWLAFFGGDGFGFGRRGNALTQAELQEGFNNQNVMRALEGIKNGVCDGFYAMNTNALQGQNQQQRDMCRGFDAVTAGVSNTGYQLGNQIAENRFVAQQCCCEQKQAIASLGYETNRNIDAVRYENARNTCEIVTAVKEDGEKTRAVLIANQIQELRDKLADRDRELQAERYQVSQLTQNGTIIEAVRQLLGQRGCAGCQYLTAA